MSDQGYAGDINPSETWQVLEDEPESVLVDVRTDAEWTYVGLPDLGGIKRIERMGCKSFSLCQFEGD